VFRRESFVTTVATSRRNVSPPEGGASPARGQRRSSIVEAMLADIFAGQLQAGERLVTDRLAARYAVSHTPIREALITLAGIGLIDLLPNRGAVVRSLSRKEVREVCGVRRALECEAVRRAAKRIPQADLKPLAEAFQRLSSVAPDGSGVVDDGEAIFAEARQRDSELHDLIAAHCDNDFLRAELNRLKLLFRAFRDGSYSVVAAARDFRRIPEEAREHLAIVEALLSGDATLAVSMLGRHIRQGVKYWSRGLPG
jgi:DNA-binding GntR family transcriptional regulator